MALYAHEKVRGILEGEYGSVFKGRSMDFDDLREYIPGDDVKDIDWKATARSGSVRIRRYIAVRKHNILLVVDTGRNMSAVTESGESKKAAAVLLAGIVGSVAIKHGDFVGLVHGDSTHSAYVPLKTGRTHLEQILQKIDNAITDDAEPSDLATQLEYVARNLRRKMLVVVISDEFDFDDRTRAAVRRLRAQHEILWAVVSDADLTATGGMVDVADWRRIPAYLRADRALQTAYRAAVSQQRQQFDASLSRLSIVCERIGREAEAVHQVFRLLERHKSARRS